MLRSYQGVVAAIGLGALIAAPVKAQDDLRTKVDQLEQELRILKRQLEVEKETAADKAKSAKAPPVVSFGEKGVVFQSADTNFTFKLHGYLQADGRFYPNDANSASPNDTFLLRRVRPIFEGTVYRDFEYRIMLEFATGSSLSSVNNSLVQDGYINWRLQPWLQFQLGKYKAPVSLDRLQPDAYLQFIERTYTSELAPNREVGFELHGDLFDNRLTYAAGIFNGVGDNDSADIEGFDDEKDFEGRIFATPFKESEIKPLQKLGFGIAGTIGNHEGPLKSLLTPGQQTMFTYTPANVGTNTVSVTQDGEQWRIAPQLYYYWGPFGMFGEYIISNQQLRRNRPDTFGTVRNKAWSVSASYFLTGEENTFQPVKVKHPFSLADGGWGGLEFVARVHQLDIDDRAFPLFANPATAPTEATSWGVGLNWHLNPNVKISFNYENTKFKGGTTAFLSKGEEVVMTRAQLTF